MGAPYTNQVVLLCVLVFSVATLHMLVGHLRVPGGSHAPRTARNGLSSSSSSLRPAETAIGDALGGAMDGSYEKETGAESDLRFAGGGADPDETDTGGNTEGNIDQKEEDDDDVDNDSDSNDDDETAGGTKENGGAETDGDRDKDQKDGDNDDDETVDDNREDDDDDETVDDNREDDDDETVDDMNKGMKDDDEDDGTNDDSNQDDDETGDANGKEDGDDNNDNDDGNIANDDGNIANDDGDNNGGSSGSSDKPKPTREEVAASNMAIYNNITSGNTTSLINGLEFVDDVDETGHFVHRLARPRPVSALKVPTPIFVLSLSKSGTTTVHQYFQCGLGIGASAHHRYPYKKQPKLRYVGKTMRANRIADQPLLSWRPGRDKPEKKKNRKGGGGGSSSESSESREFTEEELVPDVLEDYQVFSDFDLYRPGKKSIDFMVDNLDNIGRFYPNATILYLNRDAASWYNSAKNFGSLLRRWKNFSVSPLVESLFGQGGRENLPDPKDPEAEEAWVSFYEKYTELVRGFATGKAGDNDLHLPHNGLNTNHSITYLEIPLDDRTGGVLEETVGLPGECFGHANLGTLDKREKGLKTKGGRPEAHPREWTVNTYAEA